VIHVFGAPDPPTPRLIAALVARGHTLARAPDAKPSRPATLVLGAEKSLDALALGALAGAWKKTGRARLLVLSALGAHPDARAPRLRRLWQLEESARELALPVLVLRLGPLFGPDSPLWRKLRSRPRLPRGGRALIQPVAELDVLETLERALDGRAAWKGWYEVAGSEPLTLAEMVELAARGPRDRASLAAAAWEPPLDEMNEHRLAEPEPWIQHFQITPRPIREQAAAWA
jgi:hypothetical protein